MNTSILLVGDDPNWRQILSDLINNEADLQVVYAVDTCEEAILYCTINKVHIVLMNIKPDPNVLDSLQVMLELSLIGVGTRVIALTWDDRVKDGLDACVAGVIEYVSKDNYREIPDRIRRVMDAVSPQGIIVKQYIRMKEAELG